MVLTKLVLKTVRDAAGGDTVNSAAIGFLRVDGVVTGASLWFRNNRIGINTLEPVRTLGIAGTVAARPGTTGSGSNATWLSISGSDYELLRNTSALKYKTDVDYDVDYLADIELRPNKHWRLDDEVYLYGFVADDLVAENELLGIQFEGEIDDFHDRALLAVMAAKINRLEAIIERLESECH